MDTQEALESLEEFIKHLEARLLGDGDFRRSLGRILHKIHRQGLGLRVEVTKAGKTVMEVSPDRRGVESEILSRMWESVGPVACVAYAWHVASVTEAGRADVEVFAEEIMGPLRKALSQHWGTRDQMTLLPLLNQGNNEALLEKTIGEACSKGIEVIVARLDIDDFKQVNTDFGYETGSKVLAELGDRVRGHFGEESIIIRIGGDEYGIFFLDEAFATVMTKVETFREEMKSKPFQAINIPKSCTIGVCAFPAHVAATPTGTPWHKTLLDAATQIQEKAKKESRNCIRVCGEAPAGEAVESLATEDLQRCALRARQGLLAGDRTSYGDGFQDFLSQQLRGTLATMSLKQCGDALASALKTFGVQPNASVPICPQEEERASPLIHPLRLAEIVLNALLRNPLQNGGPLTPSSRLFLAVTPGVNRAVAQLVLRVENEEAGSCVFACGDVPWQGQAETCYAGKPWYRQSEDQAGRVIRWVPETGPPSFLSPCLLVAIGQDSLQLGVQEFAASVVQVDDRPVSGGGLPDFWQSNVSRVVQQVLKNPNISHVLVVGNAAMAPRTLSVLGGQLCPDASFARRLSADTDAIEGFLARKVRITNCGADAAEAVRCLCEIYFGAEETLSPAASPRDISGEKQRRRRIQMALPTEKMTAAPTDGLRCSSLADAYPRVIHILRTADLPRYSDQMGRRFTELQAFRLVLDSPLSDRVPDYWADDRAQLEHYFVGQFIQAGGLFHTRLRAWGRVDGNNTGVDQVDHAVQAICRAIRTNTADRRIMLFVAQPDPPNDLAAPLGLTSVHALPRWRGNRWELDWVWYWRTVEAIVGFPFSAYASTRQSEEILRAVNEAIGAEDTRQASMGRLFYVASSLHMFVDPGDHEIARAIVADAFE